MTVLCGHTLVRRRSQDFVETINETTWLGTCRHFNSVNMNCKLVQPVVATPRDARATVTIPAGAVVELRPTLHKGSIAEVLWEGEWFSAQIEDVLGACRIEDVGRFGWY